MATLSDSTLAKFTEAIRKSEQKPLVSDLFTAGLYLLSQGKDDAGWKACYTATRFLDISESLRKRLMANIRENIKSLAVAAWGHSELKDLIIKPGNEAAS